MYDSTTTVTVGLDVHARSVRLAAVRADELVEERTLPYDEEAVERALRRWPGSALLLRGGPDRVWSVSLSRRAGARLPGGGAGVGAAAAGRQGQDRPAGRAQARAAARRRPARADPCALAGAGGGPRSRACS